MTEVDAEGCILASALDFIIVSTPRAGSHMLATALDSHPDICCFGEVDCPERIPGMGLMPGYITGAIVHGSTLDFYLGKVKRIIHLVRSPADVARSFHRTQHVAMIEKTRGYDNAMHALAPMEIPPLLTDAQFDGADRIALKMQGMQKRLRPFNTFAVDYDELCHNRDARELFEPIARELTAYLGVDYAPLRPLTYKPTERSQ